MHRNNVDGNRTEQSLGFEAWWRNISEQASEGRVPSRDQINPADIKSWLPSVMIIELDQNTNTMPIRLSGTNQRTRFGVELSGLDYLTLLVGPVREVAFDIAMAMHDQPCGLWQTMPVDFQSGDSYVVESTAFPFIGTNGKRHIISMVDYLELAGYDLTADEKATIIGVATQLEFLDIGTGQPTHLSLPFS